MKLKLNTFKIFSLMFVLNFFNLNNALAAGLGLHVVMANKAIEETAKFSPELADLLTKHSAIYHRAALFPDINHIYPTEDFSEWTHWTDFLNRYGKKFTETCSYPWNLKCEKLLAFYFGILAHDIGDTNFDRHFVTEASRRDFDSNTDLTSDFTDRTMDLMAMVELGDLQNKLFFSSWMPDVFISEVINEVHPGMTPEKLRIQSIGTHALYSGMLYFAQKAYPRMINTYSTWAQKNYWDAKGGVLDTAKVMSENFEIVWNELILTPKRDQFPKLCEDRNWPNVKFLLCQP